MKVTLDLSKLLKEGRITPQEAQRLTSLSASGTGALGINILIGFGVVAVSAGTVALLPSVYTAIPIAAVLFGAGLLMTLSNPGQWGVLAQILLVIGALLGCAATAILGSFSALSFVAVTLMLAIASVIARNGLLMGCAVLAASAALGARTGYMHAMYSLAIYEPTLTIVLFSVVALVGYLVSLRVSADYERLATMAARTSMLMINFGFWIGSLWGDPFWTIRRRLDPSLHEFPMTADRILPSWPFAVVWALALLGLALWGLSVNRRWVVNVAAVFGAIHFYTQWFERLGATPGAILIGGLLMLGLALGLWSFNKRAEARAA